MSETNLHLSAEWAEVVAATTRAVLALQALDVAIRTYAAVKEPTHDR